ncbi:MAG TPA: hypothetical protein PKD91_14165 [Bacteroidia bacterium]|nr:hypothetical protein [Bacteroidia bacterium]
MYEAEAYLVLRSLTAEAQLQVNITAEEGTCPIITEIDGGNSGNDSQFGPINGNLDGGGA